MAAFYIGFEITSKWTNPSPNQKISKIIVLKKKHKNFPKVQTKSKQKSRRDTLEMEIPHYVMKLR